MDRPCKFLWGGGSGFGDGGGDILANSRSEKRMASEAPDWIAERSDWVNFSYKGKFI